MKKSAIKASQAVMLAKQISQAHKEVAQTFALKVINKKGFKIEDTDRAVNNIAIFEGKLNQMQSK